MRCPAGQGQAHFAASWFEPEGPVVDLKYGTMGWCFSGCQTKTTGGGGGLEKQSINPRWYGSKLPGSSGRFVFLFLAEVRKKTKGQLGSRKASVPTGALRASFSTSRWPARTLHHSLAVEPVNRAVVRNSRCRASNSLQSLHGPAPPGPNRWVHPFQGLEHELANKPR